MNCQKLDTFFVPFLQKFEILYETPDFHSNPHITVSILSFLCVFRSYFDCKNTSTGDVDRAVARSGRHSAVNLQ